MKREYPTRPVVGVGILIKKGRDYLFIKRASEPDKGMWTIPGGLIEVGETAREAAAREAIEETGLKVEIAQMLDVVDKIVLDDSSKVKYHFIVVYFLAFPQQGEMKPSSDASDARWLKREEFSKYLLTESFTKLLEDISLDSLDFVSNTD